MKLKMGRPKLPKGDVRAKLIQMRVTSAEYGAIQKASKSDGKDVSEWARTTLLKALEH